MLFRLQMPALLQKNSILARHASTTFVFLKFANFAIEFKYACMDQILFGIHE